MKISKLVITPRSPFARRVRLALLRFEIPFQEEEATPFEPTEKFIQQNPLGQVPVVILENAAQWIDSSAILENLFDQGFPVWPKDAEKRIHARQLATLSEGLMSAAVSYFLERQRAEKADASWLEDHEAVVKRTLKLISEKYVGELKTETTQATWDLGVALEYLSLRMAHIDWKKDFPNLTPILDQCGKSPHFLKTSPPAA